MFGTFVIADLTINFNMIRPTDSDVDFSEPFPENCKFNVTTVDFMSGSSKTAIVDGDKFMKALALGILFDGRVPETSTEVHEFWKDAEEAVRDLHRIMP